MTNIDENKKLKLSLLSLRIGIFIVFIMWTIDKFVNQNIQLEYLKGFI
jgi:hypothetical protein